MSKDVKNFVKWQYDNVIIVCKQEVETLQDTLIMG